MKRKKTKKQKHKPTRQLKQPIVSKSLRFPIFLAFFLSGYAGLMHQVVWAKLLVQLIGATAYAQVVVLAVFMGGLAIGAVLFGRQSDRNRRPLRTYLVLELLIGAYCLALPLFLYLAGLGYVGLATYFFELPTLTLLLRFILVTLLILFPAVLMGATLPVLARHLISRAEDTQRQVANLYALNSFGAVLGAGFAGFVTLPLYGIYVSLVVASLLNLVAGGVVLRSVRRETAESQAIEKQAHAAADTELPAKPSGPAPSYRSEQYTVTLFALFLSGFAAMGYEILFTRIIALSFGSSTYSFSVMLMSFITGIGIGSAIVSRLNIKRPMWLLGASQLAVVATLLMATPLISRMPYLIGLLRIELQSAPLGFELYQLGKALLCLAVLLAPTICLGVSFPLVARIQVRTTQDIGAKVGTTYAWNTMGNVLGVVVTSLVLLPWLGLRDAFHFNLALNFIAGSALLLIAVETGIGRRALAGGCATLIVVIYAQLGTHWPDAVNLAQNHLRLRTGPAASLDAAARARHPSTSFSAWKETYVARPDEVEQFFFDEDAHATVLVAGQKNNLRLYINTKPDASNSIDLDTQLLLAHAPLFLAADARKVLIIGHGSGITAGSVMLHPVEHVDLVEISPAVLRADAMFAGDNYGVMNGRRTRSFVDDGQTFLRTVPDRYDVIISEPPNPWIAGVGGLFTVEYFENARKRLNPGGLFAFWFHTYEQSDEAVQLIVRTAASVYPYVMLFADNDLGNIVAVASMQAIEPDFEKMEQRYSEPAVRHDLARLKMPNLTSLLSHHRVSQKRFRSLINHGPLNTVGHQRLEYIAPRSFFRRDNSFVLDNFDPLIKGESQSDILLDRYIAYRADTGKPMTRRELNEAAVYSNSLGGYGPKVAKSIIARIR